MQKVDEADNNTVKIDLKIMILELFISGIFPFFGTEHTV
jgi:hypothetical protein